MALTNCSLDKPQRWKLHSLFQYCITPYQIFYLSSKLSIPSLSLWQASHLSWSLEKIMQRVLLVHIPGDTREKKVRGKSQHRLIKDKLGLNNLITFYDKIIRSVNGRRAVNIIYLDLSKAFYAVFHNIIESKLGHYSWDGQKDSWRVLGSAGGG